MSLFYKTTISKKEVTESFVKGQPQSTFSNVTTFQGNVQPYKGRAALDQTEGVQSSGMMVVFSEETLNIASAEGTRKGTHVLYHDNWYECISELDWGRQEGVFESLSYFRYVMVWREVNV